ncbi:MAG TPA: AMP-binding protein, partial [Terriglobia bacterium]|nr:AMP-binding protein [Terriglobia bacterium]
QRVVYAAPHGEPMPVAQAQLDRSAIEEQVLEIFRGLLRELGSENAARSVALNSGLERDLGLGSLERVELLVRCERRFARRLPDAVAQQAETPEDWVRALLTGQAAPSGNGARRERYRIEQPAQDAPPAPQSARTWVDVLRHHAGAAPDRIQIHLLDGDFGQDITYAKLWESASHVAAGLQARGLAPNETVAIMLPTSAEFFYAFFGVMLAGGIAVPIYPPARPDRIEEYVRRQVKILRNAEVRFLITFSRARSVSQLMGLSLPSLLGVTSVGELDAAGRHGDSRPRPLEVQPSDIAFIQYTSGSTGDPKGVVLTQANVLANVRGIGWAVKFRPDDVVVTWLPLYHDMGLIGSWLFSVYFGAPITVLSPLDFLARPARWLWALHDSGGTLCPAPNFAYELCARKIRDDALVGLDLSRWRIAINAGEAVLPETLARFAERFRPYGFRPEAYVPCYGLAESSVALTFPPIDRPPRIDTIARDVYGQQGRAVPVIPVPPGDSAGAAPSPADSNLLRFVANGSALPHHEVRLVDDEGREAGERVQGRILFRGLSRTPGYYRNPEASAAVIDAEGWMDSGDLGYQASGELFVTGRVKDLIIRAGHNIVPQEIEAAAADVKGVRRGCVAAFGSRDRASGTERVIVVAETRETSPHERKLIEAEIVHRVAAVAGVPADRVVLVPPQSIPKTSSGKIRRQESRSLYEAGKLGGAARPPWLQMVRLGAGNAGGWTARTVRRTLWATHRAYSDTVGALVCGIGGGLAGSVPGADRRASIAQLSARMLLRLAGEPLLVEGLENAGTDGPVILVANRAGRLDALILAAALPRPFRLADTGEVRFMPPQAADILRHLVLEAVPGQTLPPGGNLRDRIRHALAAGRSVLVLPENPAGAPSHRNRFRLDAFHAAILTGRPLIPVGVRGTSYVLDPRQRHLRHQARISLGKPLHPGSSGGRGIVELRERVRAEIAELCR